MVIPQKIRNGDTYSYRGWLISDNFFKRAFAVIGYYHVAALIIFLPIILLILFIGVIFANSLP